MASLLVIFGLIVLGPAAITLMVPTRYFGFYVAWVAMLAMVFVAWPSGPDHSSPFSGIGDSLYPIMGGALLAAIGIRGLVIAIRWKPQGAQTQLSPGLWAFTGALAGCCGVLAVSLLLSGVRPAWVAHAGGTLVILGALALLALCRRAPASEPCRIFALGFAGSAVAIGVAGGVWISSRIGAVVDAAETLAEDKPYCIQVVAVRREFEPASARLDLSPLTMRTQCRVGWCWQNHAILAIDNRSLKNWSHRRAEFRDDVLNMRTGTHLPAIVCRPVPHFARALPWL